MKYKGICQNKGKIVNEQDALCYAMQHLGDVRIMKPNEETPEFLKAIVTYYFSDNWRLIEGDDDEN